jgi:hypothetical protein
LRNIKKALDRWRIMCYTVCTVDISLIFVFGGEHPLAHRGNRKSIKINKRRIEKCGVKPKLSRLNITITV